MDFLTDNFIDNLSSNINEYINNPTIDKKIIQPIKEKTTSYINIISISYLFIILLNIIIIILILCYCKK